MRKCIYKNEQWLIYSTLEETYVIVQEIEKSAFATQYKRKIVNQQDVILKED